MPTYNNLPKPSNHFHGKWYLKLAQDLQLAAMAKRTVYGYVRAVRKLCDHHKKTPDKISQNDVRAFLLHQIVDLEVASGTQSVLLSGIKFFYRNNVAEKMESAPAGQNQLRQRPAGGHHPAASFSDDRYRKNLSPEGLHLGHLLTGTANRRSDQPASWRHRW